MYEFWIKHQGKDWVRWTKGSLDEVLGDFYYERQNAATIERMRIEYVVPEYS